MFTDMVAHTQHTSSCNGTLFFSRSWGLQISCKPKSTTKRIHLSGHHTLHDEAPYVCRYSYISTMQTRVCCKTKSSTKFLTQDTQFRVNTDLIPICRYGADVFSTSTYKVYVQGKELQVRR